MSSTSSDRRRPGKGRLPPQGGRSTSRPNRQNRPSRASAAWGARSGRRPSRSSRSLGRVCRKAGTGGGFPAGRPVDITTESTESTESRFGGLRRAKRKEAVSVESVERPLLGRLPRRAAGRRHRRYRRRRRPAHGRPKAKGATGFRTARARTTSRGAPCALRRGVVDVVDIRERLGLVALRGLPPDFNQTRCAGVTESVPSARNSANAGV